MELVTGKGATDHVSSADMASLYRGLLIADDAVLDTGDKLACTMLDANTAEIGTGDCMLQAHHARVEVAEQLTVRSGSQGFNRNDLIVARYTLGDNNVQSVYLAVIEGTAVAGAASDPAYETGDIDAGDTLVEFPIWRIPISGVNVGTPERVMPTVDTLQSQIAANDADIATNTANIATNAADITTLRNSVAISSGTPEATRVTITARSGYSVTNPWVVRVGRIVFLTAKVSRTSAWSTGESQSPFSGNVIMGEVNGDNIGGMTLTDGAAWLRPKTSLSANQAVDFSMIGYCTSA